MCLSSRLMSYQSTSRLKFDLSWSILLHLISVISWQPYQTWIQGNKQGQTTVLHSSGCCNLCKGHALACMRWTNCNKTEHTNNFLFLGKVLSPMNSVAPAGHHFWACQCVCQIHTNKHFYCQLCPHFYSSSNWHHWHTLFQWCSSFIFDNGFIYSLLSMRTIIQEKICFDIIKKACSFITVVKSFSSCWVIFLLSAKWI